MRRSIRRRLDALEECDRLMSLVESRHDASIDALIEVVDALIVITNYLRSRDTVVLPRVERIDDIVLVTSRDAESARIARAPLVTPVPNSVQKGYHGT